jgi:hypothetical protein
MVVGTSCLFFLVVYLPTLYFAPTIGVVSTTVRAVNFDTLVSRMLVLFGRRGTAQDDRLATSLAINEEIPISCHG